MLRSGGHGRLALCALIAALALPACAAPAAAAPGFVADETLSGADSSAQVVAMAPNGYAIAGWVERTSGAPVVRVAVRPPGGPWSAPQSLPVSLDSANGVSVAIASSGAAAVTWEEVTSPSTFDVAVATRAAGAASFGGPEVLRDGSQSFSPSVGIAADGTVTVLYTANPNVVVRDFPAGGSALAATLQPLAASCSTSFGNGISVVPSGDAVAPLACGGASFALRTGGRWSVSPTVADDVQACPSSSTYHSAVMAAIDSAGHAVGVMETHVHQPDPSCSGIGVLDSDSYSEQLVLPLGGVMTPVVTPVASGGSFGFAPPPISAPQAAISPSGIAFAWSATDIAFRSQAHVRFFAPDGSGGTADQPVGTAATGATVVPRLALARDGRGLLAWVDGTGANAQIVAAERAPGTNAFGDPVPVSGSSNALSAPSLAMDDTGDGAVAWSQGSAPALVHVRGFDATPPLLSGVTIPSTARAGLPPAAFAASASDVWGPVGLSWSFGDGTSGSGGAPTHVYLQPGTHTVTVTATDAAGNASSQSGTVTVASPVSGTLRMTSASLTHKTFRVGRSSTPLTGVAAARRRARRAPVGTTFRFTLEVPRVSAPFATAALPLVKIAISHSTFGRLSGHRCVKPTRRLARHRRCTRRVVDGTLSRGAHAGANSVAFSGRLGRRALAPGRYAATLTPFWGGRTAAPRTLRFTVVR